MYVHMKNRLAKHTKVAKESAVRKGYKSGAVNKTCVARDIVLSSLRRTNPPRLFSLLLPLLRLHIHELHLCCLYILLLLALLPTLHFQAQLVLEALPPGLADL